MYMNQVRLLVSDYGKSFDFYKTTLGLELAFGDEASGYAEFLTGSDTSALALMDKQFLPEGVASTQAPTSTDAFNLTFTVDSVDDLHKSLTAEGVQFLTPPTTREEMGGRTAHLRDSEGNLIELYELLEDARS